jgi:uncharacterized protein (DUF305 family)
MLKLAVLAALALPSVALAQEATDHSGMAMEGPMAELMAPMHAMMDAMPTGSTGLPDADFLLMMIPHHQSAIAMARVQLEQGESDEIKALAQTIIDQQEVEIADMRAMLERMGVEPPPAPAE